jgi:hypothetical protein
MEQYLKAETNLVKCIHTIRKNDSGAKALVEKAPGSPTDTGDKFDNVYDQPILSEQQEAYAEWMHSCTMVKGSAHFPKRNRDEGLLEIGPIKFGIVEPGEDMDANPLVFNKCNLADFIDKTGYFNLVKFLGFNCHIFPFLYKLSCCLAAMRVT